MAGAAFDRPGMEASNPRSLVYPQCLARSLTVEQIGCSEAEEEEQLWVGKMSSSVLALLSSEGPMGHPSRQRCIYVCVCV